MRAIKLTIQYDGTRYSGWQIQRKGPTIQGVLEDALFSVTGEEQRVTGASRTDAGVHALHQVARFHTQSDLMPDVFLRALNAHLPEDIRITASAEADSSFHPRFDASGKAYRYLITRKGFYSVFLGRYSWQLPFALNSSAMADAARLLTGSHDFTSFRASRCSAPNPVRTVQHISVSEEAEMGFLSFSLKAPNIMIRIEAQAFLRHMVRNIVGTLVDVGKGKLTPQDVQDILQAKDRQRAGRTAPASGLFLESIQY